MDHRTVRAAGLSPRYERERLQALAGYRVDSAREPEFDSVAALAARTAACPRAVVTFLDGRSEWLKAVSGEALPDVEQRESFGRTVVDTRAPLVVEDATADERFAAHPWVREHDIRFYAGVPLLAPGEIAIGTLAVLDTEPRSASAETLESLRLLTRVLMPHLEHRREEALVQNLTCVIGYDGRLQRVSPAWQAVLGWTPEEMIGQAIEDLVHPDDVSRTRARTQRILAGHRTGGFENRYRTRNGTYRWLLWHSQLVPHERRFYAVAKDITDRKRNELALRESEARYRLLAENATDLIMGHELDGRVTYASGISETLTGYRSDELVGMGSYDLIHPADHDRVRRVHDHLLETLQPNRISYRFVRKDGSFVWVESISRIVRDQRSRPVGIQSATRDISETKRAVEALEAAREHFRRAFDDAPIGMSIVDPDKWRFERVNRAFCDLLGYDEDELLAIAPPELIHPDDRGDEVALTEEVLAGARRSFAMEKRHVHKDGHLVWARVTVSVMRDHPDAEPRLLAHIEDVSARRRSADEIQAAREQAERANQAKSDFLSRMSHELRTPLNAVLGFAQLLQQDDLDPVQTESVDRIMKGGKHLLELVNDVLDISSIEAGRMPIATERVSCAEVVQETLELMTPLADARPIKLCCTLPDDDVAVCGNHQRLKQVLLNLVSNAIKYGRADGCVRLTVERTPDMRGRISVRDDGPGIPADQLAKAFTPFERLGAKSSVEGTGLGLPLSRNLVQAMGGTIDVKSSSEGSTFTVELPLMAGNGDEPAPRTYLEPDEVDDARLAAEPTAGAAAPVARHVLYIEDNPANVELVRRVVARHPEIELSAVDRGDTGLELALREPPDAIILDLHLPDMSGASLVRALHDDPRTAKVPLIVVTGDVSDGHEQTILAAGATVYLRKPLDLVRFERELERALARAEAPAGS